LDNCGRALPQLSARGTRYLSRQESAAGLRRRTLPGGKKTRSASRALCRNAHAAHL